MGREEMLGAIFTQFDHSAQQCCQATNGVFCDIDSTYKGEKKPQNLKRRMARIYYSSFVAEFVYTAHGVLGTVNSILSCNICLDKGENSIGIPLPLAADYCGVDVDAPLCIPFITNPQAMEQAVQCIGGVLESLLPVFAEISCDERKQQKFLTAFHNEIKFIFDIEELSVMPEEAIRSLVDFFVFRFSDGAFLNALRGNYGKAVKQLKKIKNLTGYERRMLRLWSQQGERKQPEIDAVIKNVVAYSGYGTTKAELKEFAAMFISWIALTPGVSALYLGLYFLMVWLEGRNSVCLMGPYYNFPYCIMAGFITAIALSYFTRFHFYRWLFKKDYDQYSEMENTRNLGAENKLMKGFLGVLVVAGIALSVLVVKWNLNFLEDGFVDNSKFLALQGQYHPYSEIQRVYYKPDRVNGYGETIDYPSYVIVLEDGHEIDLYEHGDIDDYEDVLLAFLIEQGVEVEKER